jgi:hypothetical protein
MVAGIFLNVVAIISLWRSFNNFEINCATLWFLFYLVLIGL